MPIDPEQLIQLYRMMVRIRTFEETVLEMFRTGRGPRHSHLSIGQEAVAAGACLALRPDDYVTSTHRGHHHLIAKGGHYKPAMAEIAVKVTGYCGGKGGTMHIADFNLGMLGAISIVAGGIPIAVGAAISARLRGTDQVTVCFFGEGGASQGNFNEGLNMAALWNLPVIFLCENNQYMESSRFENVTAGSGIYKRAEGYGMPGVSVDGNDVVEVYEATRQAVDRARKGEGPTLLECLTYRRMGHNTNDPAEYRSEEELKLWEQKDPIDRFRTALIDEGLLTPEEDEQIRGEFRQEGQAALEFALASPVPGEDRLFTDIYAPAYQPASPSPAPGERQLSYRKAVREALAGEMERDDAVFMIGEDIGAAGGIFKVTAGLQQTYGVERVRDAPISENTIAGAVIGAALTGMRPVGELMFIDLITLAMDQIVNLGAKIRYMTGGQASVPGVIRVTYGGGLAAGATHSQNLEAWFYHIPGLKLVMASTPYDAKGLLKTAIRDDNLVLFLEHKALYNVRGPVPEEEYLIPLGVADVKREGTDATVVATGRMVQEALKAAERLAGDGIEIEVIDPRTLSPLDEDTILESVEKTGRLVVFQEASEQGGFGSDLIRIVCRRAFYYLDAAPAIVGAAHTPIPMSPTLEQKLLPTAEDLIQSIQQLVPRLAR